MYLGGKDVNEWPVFLENAEKVTLDLSKVKRAK
jgi:hypothetical protein